MAADDKLIDKALHADAAYKSDRISLALSTRARAKAVAKLHDSGMSLRDIGTLLGMHHTRVQQLLAEAAAPKRLKVRKTKRVFPRILVRAQGSDTWHWCSNCSHYPSSPVARRVVAKGKHPRGGELCDECKAKERANVCSTPTSGHA